MRSEGLKHDLHLTVMFNVSLELRLVVCFDLFLVICCFYYYYYNCYGGEFN